MPIARLRDVSTCAEFQEYFQKIQTAGALDPKTKEWMHLALVLLSLRTLRLTASLVRSA